MLDTQQLIRRWQAGEERAAQLLYDQHSARAFRLAYGLLGNVEDAEEAAQDALAYALINIEKYKADRAQFSTWLHTIVVSRARDKQRRKRFSLVALSDWMGGGHDVADSAPMPEQFSEQMFTRKAVWDAVQDLKPQLREAIVLRYWAGHSFREMAEILECPMGTTQSRVRRGFDQLRQTLGNLPEVVEFG